MLGYYTVRISADRREVDIVPDRSGMLHLNALRLLEVDPCTDCLAVEEIEALGEGRVKVKIGLTHPFPPEYPKLTAFDVRGIVMLPGSYQFPNAGVDVSWEQAGDPVLVGADGYTRLFNPDEFPEDSEGPPALGYITGRFAMPGVDVASLNPYLIFVPSGDYERNYFPPGQSASRTYDLKLPPGPIELGYAVDCCWELMDGEVNEIPDDFPISVNCAEAYKIWVSIGKGLTPTGTGSANVRIEVFDWQGADTIEKVLVEAPELFAGEIEGQLSTVGEESFVYYAHIQNSLHAPVGDYPILVTVKDTEEDPNLGPMAAYQMATAHVSLTGVWIRELVLIPAGDFVMGSDPDSDPQALPFSGEMPQHMHPTAEYYIGKYEITSEEYAAFIADNGYLNPLYWSADGWAWRVAADITKPSPWNEWPQVHSHIGIQFPDYPIYQISWYEAEAFCNWAAGRLPSEAEWEKAARGTDGRIYPWGNEWDPSKVNYDDGPFSVPEPVGSYSPEGDSPYGLADASGNVKEWVFDWLDLKIYEQYAAGDFTPPSEPWPLEDFKGLRGGDWSTTYENRNLRCADRYGLSTALNAGGIRIVFDP